MEGLDFNKAWAENRRGKYLVTGAFMREPKSKNLIQSLQARTLIQRLYYNGFDDMYVCEAVSPDFAPVSMGEQTPLYTVVVTRKSEEGKPVQITAKFKYRPGHDPYVS